MGSREWQRALEALPAPKAKPTRESQALLPDRAMSPLCTLLSRVPGTRVSGPRIREAFFSIFAPEVIVLGICCFQSLWGSF